MEIEAFHLLLRRSWQSDNKTVYHRKKNVYTFYKNGLKVALAPMKEQFVKSNVEQEPSYLTVQCFLNEVEGNGVVFLLLVKEVLEGR